MRVSFALLANLCALFLCSAREHAQSRSRARSFLSACPWITLCVHREGCQLEVKMPSKIIFEDECQAMEEEVDTGSDVKVVKVSRFELFYSELTEKVGSSDQTSAILTCGGACG